MECFLGDLIDPEGWLKFNGDVALSTLHHVEYGNRGPRADTKGRITWPGYNIVNNSNDVQEYTVNRFINGTNWLPRMGGSICASFYKLVLSEVTGSLKSKQIIEFPMMEYCL